MAAGEEDGLVDATTSATRGHDGRSDAGLRGKIAVGSVYVDGEFFVEDFLDLVIGEFVERGAGALAEAAEIDGEDVNAGGREFLGEVVPNFALAIALVEEEQAGAGLGGGEESGFEVGAVGRSEIEAARGGGLLRGGREGDEEKSQDGGGAKWMHEDLRGNSLQSTVHSARVRRWRGLSAIRKQEKAYAEFTPTGSG